MRARALIHIAGPGGAGKTTFVETLLRAKVAMFAICVRGQHDKALRKERESKSISDPELRRYRRAGASGVALYQFSEPHTDAFFMSGVMEEYSEVVFIEGDCPLDYVDLSIFLAPPPPRGVALLRRVKRGGTGSPQAAFRAYEQALESPGALARLLGAHTSDPLVALALRQSNLLGDFKRFLADQRDAARDVAPGEHWAITEGYEGIERAQLVVVNVRKEADRPAADALVEDVARLRRDPEVFLDLIRFRGNKIPVTAVAGDVSNPNDAGLKKALARVRRAISQRNP